jgi:Leucine-rich repeat (LRR) protein
MKQIILVFIIILFCTALFAQKDLTPQQIKNKMTQIRENTDWSDPVASKKANEEIKTLSKQLMMSRVNNNPANQTDSVHAEIQKENIEAISDQWNQIMEASKYGKNADILLGKPIREEIVEAYREDESPKNITPEFFKEMNILVLDMSIPTVQRTIDVMQNYKGIEILIITSGKNNTSVNLGEILKKAAKFPLKELYVINFGQFVSSIPKEINQFKNLSTLALFNNNLSQLPDTKTFASKLDSLFIDMNPINSLFPAIGSMKNLKKLGIAKTSISDAEIKEIEKLLPNCEVTIK